MRCPRATTTNLFRISHERTRKSRFAEDVEAKQYVAARQLHLQLHMLNWPHAHLQVHMLNYSQAQPHRNSETVTLEPAGLGAFGDLRHHIHTIGDHGDLAGGSRGGPPETVVTGAPTSSPATHHHCGEAGAQKADKRRLYPVRGWVICLTVSRPSNAEIVSTKDIARTGLPVETHSSVALSDNPVTTPPTE